MFIYTNKQMEALNLYRQFGGIGGDGGSVSWSNKGSWGSNGKHVTTVPPLRGTGGGCGGIAVAGCSGGIGYAYGGKGGNGTSYSGGTGGGKAETWSSTARGRRRME